MWVVLIAGSTGSALRAVRPPNFTPDVGAISLTRERDGFLVALALAIMAQAIRRSCWRAR